MFVRRTRAGAGQMPDVIPFEHHYALARAYAQEVRYDFAIPRIHGLQCPTLAQDAEGNAMMKAILFGLVECEGPGFCNHIGRFGAILGPGPSPCPAHKAGVQLLTFESFWRAHRARLEILANEAQQRSDNAKRIPVLRDTTLFKTWLPEVPSQHSSRVRSIRAAVKDSCRFRYFPHRVSEHILAFLCATHVRPWRFTCCQYTPLDVFGRVPRVPLSVSKHILSFLCSKHGAGCCGRDLDGCESIHWGHHRDQPTEEEFCAFIAREVVTNLDLSAEAHGHTKD